MVKVQFIAQLVVPNRTTHGLFILVQVVYYNHQLISVPSYFSLGIPSGCGRSDKNRIATKMVHGAHGLPTMHSLWDTCISRQQGRFGTGGHDISTILSSSYLERTLVG